MSTIQFQAVPDGAARRCTMDHDLHYLFAEIQSARAADRLSRGQRLPVTSSRGAADRLALSLGAYAKALEQYRLPVPPAIRDELRLRSAMPS